MWASAAARGRRARAATNCRVDVLRHASCAAAVYAAASPMPDLLDRVREELNARIRELRPVVREFERLERAAKRSPGPAPALSRGCARESTQRPPTGPQRPGRGASAGAGRQRRSPHGARPRLGAEPLAKWRRADRPRRGCSRLSPPRPVADRPRLEGRAVSRPGWRRRRCRGWPSRVVCGASGLVATRSSTRMAPGCRPNRRGGRRRRRLPSPANRARPRRPRGQPARSRSGVARARRWGDRARRTSSRRRAEGGRGGRSTPAAPQ